MTASIASVSLAALALLVVIAFAVAMLRRVRASTSMQGAVSGDESVPWSIAGGVHVGPLQFSGAAMRGGIVAWQVHLFGRSIARRAGPSPSAPPRPKSRTRRALERRALGMLRRTDPAVALELALDAFAHVRLESLDVKVRFGAVDPLISGKVAAVLAVLSGTLAPVATIRSSIDWAAEDDAIDLRLEGQASFVPMMLAYDLARFLLKHAFAPLLRLVARARASLRRPRLADAS